MFLFDRKRDGICIDLLLLADITPQYKLKLGWEIIRGLSLHAAKEEMVRTYCIMQVLIFIAGRIQHLCHICNIFAGLAPQDQVVAFQVTVK